MGWVVGPPDIESGDVFDSGIQIRPIRIRWLLSKLLPGQLKGFSLRINYAVAQPFLSGLFFYLTNYSQYGWYFITICIQDRECLFGNIVVGTGVGTGFKPVPTLSEIIRGFKTFSALTIKKYIRENPLNWQTDRNNPINL